MAEMGLSLKVQDSILPIIKNKVPANRNRLNPLPPPVVPKGLRLLPKVPQKAILHPNIKRTENRDLSDIKECAVLAYYSYIFIRSFESGKFINQ